MIQRVKRNISKRNNIKQKIINQKEKEFKGFIDLAFSIITLMTN